MSTTIKAAAITLIAWFGSLAALTLAIEPTRDVIVFGAAQSAMQAPVGLLDAHDGFVRVRGSEAGFVRALYANGAWLVLPASNGGCRGRVIDVLVTNRQTGISR